MAATSSSSKRASGRSTASSLWLHLVNGSLAEGLATAFERIRNRISGLDGGGGASYLDLARERLGEATARVFAWSRRHPGQAAVALGGLVLFAGIVTVALQAGDEDAEDGKGGSRGRNVGSTTGRSTGRRRTGSARRTLVDQRG